MHDLSMPLWERYLMTIEEASNYFRIVENKLRQIANDHKRECVVRNVQIVIILKKIRRYFYSYLFYFLSILSVINTGKITVILEMMGCN